MSFARVSSLSRNPRDRGEKNFRRSFWAEFNEWCGEQPSIVEAFGDVSDRPENERGWSDYKGGLTKCHITIRANTGQGRVGVGPWLYDRKPYGNLYALKDEIENDLAGEGVSFKWSWLNGKSAHPEAIVYCDCNFEDDWTELFAWMGYAMLRMRAYALRAGL